MMNVQPYLPHSSPIFAHTKTTPLRVHYVVDALMQGGRSDVVLDMLSRTDAPSYGYQLAQGATSLTEAWDANPSSSQDHLMLGDAEEWLYRGLGGIDVNFARQDNSRILLRPAVLKRVKWVHTGYRSAFGLIESDWKHEGRTQVEYDYEIPATAKATIELNSANPRSLTVNGVSSSKASGEISTRFDGDAIKIVVGSGHYQIRAASPGKK